VIGGGVSQPTKQALTVRWLPCPLRTYVPAWPTSDVTGQLAAVPPSDAHPVGRLRVPVGVSIVRCPLNMRVS